MKNAKKAKHAVSLMLLVTALAMLALVPAAASADRLSGTVSTDGSTSMEKVIGALGEAFMEANSGVTFTYNPTGSSSGIQAVQEGRCDIGLSSRALKDKEKDAGLAETILCFGIPKALPALGEGLLICRRNLPGE